MLFNIKRIIGKSRNSIRVIAGISLGLTLIVFISGCSLRGNREVNDSITISPSATPVVASLTQTSTGTPPPSSTPEPTATNTPTITPTRTPTLFLMSILAERVMTYPGSAITIEETLEPGANYYQYYAWYESQGLKIYGLLTVPFGEKPANGWPAIVFNHGYIDPRVYRTTERYIAYVDQLARHGYIVYKIDYRGHDRSEGEATGAYGDPGYTTDVLNAVASLKAFPLADPERIGMWGHSMGGFLTLRAMVISPDIKAGVIWSGVVGSYPDMICCWHHPAPAGLTPTPNPNFRSGWRTSWQNLYGTPVENPGFWAGISANSYMKDLSGPLQLHHDAGDSEVPVKFSQDLFQEIRAAGKTSEYYEYPGDDHNIANYFNQAMQRTIEFFDRYLKGGG